MLLSQSRVRYAPCIHSAFRISHTASRGTHRVGDNRSWSYSALIRQMHQRMCRFSKKENFPSVSSQKNNIVAYIRQFENDDINLELLR